MQINSYLCFNGKCREVMNFYKECLNADLELLEVSSSPIAAQCPEAMQGQILHSSLTKDGQVLLMATDMTGPDGFQQGNNIALSVNCSSEEEINTLFSVLSSDGKIIDTLKPQFWGGLFGVIQDKYGISWMLNYSQGK